MVVGYNHIQPDLPGVGGLLHSGDAAVHRDDQAGAATGQMIQRAAVEPIALPVPVRNVGQAVQPFEAEVVREQAGGGDAVHVVVAVDRYRLPVLYGPADPVPGSLHAGDQQGIVQTVRPALQEALCGLHRYQTPLSQQRRQQRRITRLQKRRRNRRFPVWNSPFLRLHIVTHMYFKYLIIYLIKLSGGIQ